MNDCYADHPTRNMTCGTRYAYQIVGCRGAQCRQWNNANCRRRYHQRKARTTTAKETP